MLAPANYKQHCNWVLDELDPYFIATYFVHDMFLRRSCNERTNECYINLMDHVVHTYHVKYLVELVN